MVRGVNTVAVAALLLGGVSQPALTEDLAERASCQG